MTKDNEWKDIVKQWRGIANSYKRQLYEEQCMRRAAEHKLEEIIQSFEIIDGPDGPIEKRPVH